MDDSSCILASQSLTRCQLLEKAGVKFKVEASYIDEDAIKEALLLEKQSPRNIADALAEAKAVKISLKYPDAFVIGSDQTLEYEGLLFNKPEDLKALRRNLETLSGQTHKLFSAVVIAQQGRVLWRYVDMVKLSMRVISASFLEHYVEGQGEKLLSSVGGYHIEGWGAQLFDRVEGDYFTVLGLPLLPLLAQLRHYGVLEK